MAEVMKALEDLKVSVDAIGTQLADASAAVEAEKSVSFQAGKEEGKKEASAENPELKIYTEAEMEAAKVAAKEEGIAIGSSNQAAAVKSAVDAKTAEIMADFESTLVDDAAFLVKHKPVPAPAPEQV